MKNYFSIYIYGAIIILVGIFLLFSEFITFNMIKWTTGLTLSFAGLIAYVAAFSRGDKQVQFAYHELHALALMVYGMSIMIYCNTFEKLVSVTVFLFIFYSFSEIIFCNWLFNLKKKVVYKVIIIRFLLGLAIGIGTILAMTSTQKLEGFGILFIIVGINIMLYVPVMKDTLTSKLLPITPNTF